MLACRCCRRPAAARVARAAALMLCCLRPAAAAAPAHRATLSSPGLPHQPLQDIELPPDLEVKDKDKILLLHFR